MFSGRSPVSLIIFTFSPVIKLCAPSVKTFDVGPPVTAYSLNPLNVPKIVFPVLSAIKIAAVEEIPEVVSVTKILSPSFAPTLYPEISTGGLSS